MQCPYCSGDSSVTETRVTADGLRRRRLCTACKRRFTTYERLGAPGLKVAKRDGSVEPFDSDKLLTALQRVCAHRTGIADDDLRRIARDIEATLLDSGRKSVAWSDLVTLALARLENVDPVSAQRLAANYTDESGAVRFASSSPQEPSPQLGLPLRDDD
ncbi:MAG: transcriptional repressor NrdR [Deltaproteobacteria bacterium]|nr:transcriptional repressor NrdR [Deltaproteobacteria bacterium]MDQ3297148.1 ATP cone domain-containing protein [Myxococcota bacterium]